MYQRAGPGWDKGGPGQAETLTIWGIVYGFQCGSHPSHFHPYSGPSTPGETVVVMCLAGLASRFTAATTAKTLDAQVSGLHSLQVFTTQLKPQLGSSGERQEDLRGHELRLTPMCGLWCVGPTGASGPYPYVVAVVLVSLCTAPAVKSATDINT